MESLGAMGGTAAPAQSEPVPRLAVRDVTKTFAGQVALDKVAIELGAGRIHGLVGQNGSGKSTLIKILAGFHEPDPGSSAFIDGEGVKLGSALAAERAGMRFIHQDLGLVPELDVVDNLALGYGYSSNRWVSLGSEAANARRLLADFGFPMDVRRPVATLAPGAQSAVAIARALRLKEGDTPLRVLVLDEPTESLGRPEVERLFAALRQIAAGGAAILYVSHRLEEVLEVTDEVTALRDGRVAGGAVTAELDHNGLVRLIVGQVSRNLGLSRRSGEVVDSSCEGLRVAGLRGGDVDDVSFEVRAGEIVGVAGITGSGRENLAGLVGCARPRDAGEIAVGGRSARLTSPRHALHAGLVFVAADRRGQSAVPMLPVQENLTMPRVKTRGPLRWLSIRRERSEAVGWLKRFAVEPPDPARPLALLSGGNQQKVVLARALRCEPSVLVIDEPVQGVDIGARAAIFEILLEAAATGVAVLLVSSDFEDIADICDRVLVMRGGSVVATLEGEALVPDQISEESLKAASPRTREGEPSEQ